MTRNSELGAWSADKEGIDKARQESAFYHQVQEYLAESIDQDSEGSAIAEGDEGISIRPFARLAVGSIEEDTTARTREITNNVRFTVYVKDQDGRFRDLLIDVDNIESMVQKYPEVRASIIRNFAEQQAIRGQRDELIELHNKHVEMTERLIEEHNEAIEAEAMAHAEKAQINKELARLRAAQHTTASREDTPVESETMAGIKLRRKRESDPAELDDGKEPDFEDWLIKTKRKLRRDGPRDYPEEEDKIYYIFSRCKGIAAAYLRPRMPENDEDDSFETAEEVFQALTTLFRDKNKKIKAREEFKSLKYYTNGSWRSFYVKFLATANDAKIPKRDWKEELYDKVPMEMKRTVATQRFAEEVSFDVFAAALGDIAAVEEAHAKTIKKDSKRTSKSQTGRNNSATSGKKDTDKSTTPTSKYSKTKTDGMWTFKDPEIRKLAEEGKCFKCKKSGHTHQECQEGSEVHEVRTKAKKTGRKVTTVVPEESDDSLTSESEKDES